LSKRISIGSQEDRYSKRLSIERIETEGYNLNVSRYISTAIEEKEIVLREVHGDLVQIEQRIRESASKHNAFLKELDLPPLPFGQ
jgi:type I restriction enzyme M protein